MSGSPTKESSNFIQQKERKMKLKIVLEKGMDGYIVAYCPSLKGCVTQGRTEEEAIQNIKEAIELYLEPIDDDMLQFESNKREIREVAV